MSGDIQSPATSMPELPPSPLAEAKPQTLDELWRRIDSHLAAGMPQEITNSDIDGVVDYYRKLRTRFMTEQAQNIKPGRRKGDGSGSVKSVDAILARQAKAVEGIEL